MATKIPNAYFYGGSSNPYSSAANTMNNIAWAMLKNAKTPEELEAIREQAELRRAQAQHYNLQNAALEAAAAQEKNALPEFLSGFAGVDRPTTERYIKGVNTGDWGVKELPPDLSGPPQPMTRTDVIPAATGRKLDAARAAYAVRGKGNADNTMKGVADALVAGAMADATDNTGRAAAGFPMYGHAPFKEGAHGEIANVVTGAIDTNNDMAKAEIFARRSQGNASNAAANNSNASAGLHNAQAEQVRGASTGMYVPDPDKPGQFLTREGGEKLVLPASTVIPMIGKTYSADRAATAKETTAELKAGQTKNPKQLQEEAAVRKSLGLVDGQPLDSNMLQAIGADKGFMPRADLAFSNRLVSDAAAMKLQNPNLSEVDALRSAYANLESSGAFKREGAFGGNIVMPPQGGASPVAAQMSAGAKPAPRPITAGAAAQQAPAQPVAQPQVRSQQDLDAAIAAAKKAIAAGKDPVAVKKRLTEMGIQFKE